MIDLHTHSAASDGSLAPAALIALAAERGLSAIALTDHDTVAGLAEAAAAAAAAGIAFVPGVELEIAWEPGECHLLGLGLVRPSPGLTEALAALAGYRAERNRRILETLRAAGIAADDAALAAYSPGGQIGRPHIAALLVDLKVVKTRELAFRRYLGKGKPFYQPKAALGLEQAIALIHESGGVAVLAHPMSLYASWGRLASLIPEWRALGLDGLEAWHPTAKPSACRRLEAMAASLGMLATAGSDYHGEVRPDRKLGVSAGGMKIGERYLSGIPGAPAPA